MSPKYEFPLGINTNLPIVYDADHKPVCVSMLIMSVFFIKKNIFMHVQLSCEDLFQWSLYSKFQIVLYFKTGHHRRIEMSFLFKLSFDVDSDQNLPYY